MKKLFILVLLAGLMGCKNDNGKQSPSVKEPKDRALADEVKSLDFNEFQPRLTKDDDKVHVINFWATWCKPCVKELPFFERLIKETDAEVTLVSLDMPKMKSSHLMPFVKKHGITDNVVLLDDPNSNVWIPKVNEEWDGAIPATLIYKNGKRQFFARNFQDYADLKNELNKF